jgi:hypothetical protein
MAMRNTSRARRPITALAVFAIAATAGLLSACGPSGSGSPVAQQSPSASQSPVATQTPVSQPSPASPEPSTQPLPNGAVHLDPDRFRTVTVVANLFSNGSLRKVTKVFGSPAVIARLTRMVNSLPAATKKVTSCPPVTATYRLSFTVIGFEPDTTVTATSCPTDQIAIDGKVQPPLLDKSGALAAAVRGLLNLSSGS